MIQKLIPSLYLPSIYAIDVEKLKKQGIKGFIFDLDNTLVRWHESGASPELTDWMERLLSSGFKAVIVSNNSRRRVLDFVRPFSLPYIARAGKPLRSAYRRALQIMDLKGTEVAVVGDQLLTDILGGNRMGLYTILVVPVAPTDGFVTKFNRRIERIFLRWMKKKGYLRWEVKE